MHPLQLSEIDILEKVEKLTDVVAKEGEWMTKVDLVESGSKLTLVEHPRPGACGSECKTVAKAAEEILGDNDTDLGELLWKASVSWALRPSSGCEQDVGTGRARVGARRHHVSVSATRTAAPTEGQGPRRRLRTNWSRYYRAMLLADVTAQEGALSDIAAVCLASGRAWNASRCPDHMVMSTYQSDWATCSHSRRAQL